MSKNFVQPGLTVTLPAFPYQRNAGQGVLSGAFFGVAVSDTASGAAGEVNVAGVYDITKDTTLAVTFGARLYWDDTNKRLTTTATGNYHVGIAVQAQLAADATARILLSHRVPASGA